MTGVQSISLHGNLVTLREFEPIDLDDVARIMGDDRVTMSLSFDSKSKAESEAFLEGVLHRNAADPREEYYLALSEHGSGGVVGFVRLGLTGVKAGKLGYVINPDQWGKGFAADATRTLVDFGFRALSLHRISAAIGPENAASVVVAQRLGMTYEGRIRDHVFTNGSWRDSLLYSVLSNEWQSDGVA